MPSTYYIAPPDPSWSKADQDAYIPGKDGLLFTSAHEVWPGHFLQFLHSNRSSFEFGQLFLSSAFVDGWAHYAETMMWDRSDERRVGKECVSTCSSRWAPSP